LPIDKTAYYMQLFYMQLFYKPHNKNVVVYGTSTKYADFGVIFLIWDDKAKTFVWVDGTDFEPLIAE